MVAQPSFFSLDNPEAFQQKALGLAAAVAPSVYLNGNGIAYPQGGFPQMLAWGARRILECPVAGFFESLQAFHQNTWLFGYLGYDLKNAVEDLESTNTDVFGFPEYYFFEPEVVVKFENGGVSIWANDAGAVYREILNAPLPSYKPIHIQDVNRLVTRECYVQQVEAIRQHIVDGDVYELNYCIPFSGSFRGHIDSLSLYQALNGENPMPFSGWVNLGNQFLACASPERFMRKSGNTLLSQPIKGTAPRGVTKQEDEGLKQALFNSEKERAENMMIVDLVRNDLAKSAIPGSVQVQEMFGIYSFPFVHQMISSVTAQLEAGISFSEALKNAFPMGSMTGAPKIRAMQLTDALESFKRGIYSGAMGYISPGAHFDFNVIIRSIMLNHKAGTIGFAVGSAITYDSNAEAEFEECMAKTAAIRHVLGIKGF